MRILNLYSGIGGNRQLWGAEHSITSVEYDDAIAEVYSKLYPQDEIIVGDAMGFFQQHFKNFDFIWASPPCPSHGQYRHRVGVLGKGFDPIIPEMTSLYGLIVFLETYFDGQYSIENVVPYYKPLIQPRFELHRHLFWANFDVEQREFPKAEIRTKNKISDFEGYEVVRDSRIKNKRQVLRNCVNPMVGKHILDSATNGAGKPATAFERQDEFQLAN